MVVFLHVLIALSSLGLVTHSLIKPSSKSLLAGYISIIATIASGVYLVVLQPGQMLHTCVAGLAYLAVAVLTSVAARIRFVNLRSGESHS